MAITAGVRYDSFDTFGDTVNPRLALVYSPIEPTTLKFLYGTAFRAPNVSEFSYEDDGRTAKLNPDLEPEKNSTYELVCEQRLGPHWRGSVAGFLNKVTDLISTVQDPVDGLTYSDNIDKVEARGLEFQLEGQLTRDVRGRASYTFAKTEDQATGKPLNNSPEHLAKLNLTAPVVKGWLFAGGEVQYMSDRTTVADLTLDDVWLVNATLFTTRFKGVWDLSFSVYNLFDTSYRDPAAAPDTVEQDGRTLRLKLVAQF
jgi:outer membrane receptor for ferrienterochelin and colicins